MSADRNRLSGTVLWASFLLAISLWLGSALFQYLWFNENDQGFVSAFMSIDDPQTLVLRLIFTLAVIVGGYTVSQVLSRMALLEQVARDREENLAITLDSIGDAVMVTDLRGRIVRMNPVAEKLTGWTEEYARSRPSVDVFQTVKSGSGGIVPHPVDEVLETGEIVEPANDTVLVSRYGLEFKIAYSAYPITRDNKDLTGVVLVFRDVSRKYMMARELRQSESRFRSLVESSGDWIWEVDKEGVYTYSSRKVKDILGYEAEEVIGKNVYDLMPPAEAERIRTVFKRVVMERVSIVNLENTCLHKSGHRVVLETSGIPVFNDSGELTGYRGMDRDITERKLNEEALEKRLVALTRPLEDTRNIEFADLFDIEDIQRLQDEFATATGVASIITTTDGTPITKPSNFCRLCMDIIRKSEKGQANCRKSDAVIGRQCFSGPTIQPCLSGGLWDAGAAISVGGKHIGNWLIGQVRDETQTEAKMLEYARSIGADEDEFLEAFREVPIMSEEQFFGVAQVLYTLANQLSTTAYQNVQQARFITERQTAERALRESEAFLKGLFRVAPIGIGVVLGRVFKHVNTCLCEMTGYAAGELLERNARMLYESEEEFKRVGEDYRQGLALGRRKSTESRWVRKDGTVIDVLLSSTPFDPENPLKGATFTASDITVRKQTELALRKARNYITNIIDSMPSILVGVDGDGTVTQWNKTAAHTTGIEASEAYGKHLSEVFPRLQPEMEKIAESIRTQKTMQDQKKPYSCSDGTCYEDITIYPLITDGAEGAVVRIDDVTEHVRLEEMMIQSEKMLSVGGLAAGMAHEINNPLAGMMQTADVLASRLTNAELPGNVEAAEQVGISMDSIHAFMEKRGILRMLESIKESGRRAANIVNNMLSFARKGDAQLSQVSLEEMMDKTIELASADYDLKKQHDFKMIRIVREYAENVPMIYCEAGKIQQVLFNILRNGAEAMRKAQIVDPVFVVKTHFDQDRAMACLEIEDNGPGMTEEIRKRIFEPFFTTKSVGEGTGLGLSVSYFIITENHNGEMVVESRPGAGARFIIRLPIRRGLE